jgi:hypothetical protein
MKDIFVSQQHQLPLAGLLHEQHSYQFSTEDAGEFFQPLGAEMAEAILKHHGKPLLLNDGRYRNSLAIDQPIVVLLTDLKSRGLLDDETLIVWSGKFSRTLFYKSKNKRDNSSFGFSMGLLMQVLKVKLFMVPQMSTIIKPLGRMRLLFMIFSHDSSYVGIISNLLIDSVVAIVCLTDVRRNTITKILT